MLTEDVLLEKWDEVLDHKEIPTIKDEYKRLSTATLLENTEASITEAGNDGSLITMTEAAPTNVTGANVAPLKYQDPVLISLIRRSAPNLIAHDIAGIQPMKGPSGLIFFIKSRYSTQAGTEALGLDKPDRAFSGAVSGTGMSTAVAEAKDPNKMAFSIQSISVTAKSRLLAADYSTELSQDLKAVHGKSAEKELSKILSTEIMAEINREVFDTVYLTARAGAQDNVTAKGTFDLDTDSNGRWMAEKFKGLMFQIDRDANRIALETRRGRGNFIICSADVASALSIAGSLDAVSISNNFKVDMTGNSFVGILNSRYKVYIDPYATDDYLIVGYKGSNPMDAGLFYAPYVPLQLVRAIDQVTFQPKIGFRTRYGMVANPFATDAEDGAIDLTVSSTGNNATDPNIAKLSRYYRRFTVSNLM